MSIYKSSPCSNFSVQHCAQLGSEYGHSPSMRSHHGQPQKKNYSKVSTFSLHTLKTTPRQVIVTAQLISQLSIGGKNSFN